MNLPEALHLGSLTLSTTVVMWLVVLCLASWLGARIAKAHKVAFDGWFYGVLLWALVVGRAVFVLQYWRNTQVHGAKSSMYAMVEYILAQLWRQQVWLRWCCWLVKSLCAKR